MSKLLYMATGGGGGGGGEGDVFSVFFFLAGFLSVFEK